MLQCKIGLLFLVTETIFRAVNRRDPSEPLAIYRDLAGFLRLAAGTGHLFPVTNNFRELMFTRRVIIAI